MAQEQLKREYLKKIEREKQEPLKLEKEK